MTMALHHHHHRKPMVSPELALASDLFDKFCGAATLKTILSNYRNLCEILHIKPTNFPQFYPKLKSKLCSWRAQALWNKFDKRANHKCYNRGKACPNTRVLIIGAGPCGLRAAIEAQLLGAKVVVIEKRDRISRNNVLHLWPFVIQDLRMLGAKKFFGKFCAGSIEHISIRQLQCILLKVALLLGVEIHEGVGFESLVPPSTSSDGEKIGWKAKIEPEDHPVSQYEFDVLIGADGKRNTLEGFKRKEFRGKLAIAITANFINHHSEAEARVEEISGVAYIFNQKFFKDLRQATGIDLENIVYYKDDTHYFVMTAKKHSLLNKGVILKDYSDTAKLLAIENISKDALMEYAREAADFSTGYKLPQLQFAVNHYGQPDVAMFDFTSMYAAENASRVLHEKGYKLFMCLVGDSLLEPFWPTGSGCARGFLSSMDACWAVRSWGSNLMNPLEVIAERESIYRLLNQTTPENLSRDVANYTLDPHTRYPNLNTRSVLPIQVKNLYSCDDALALEQCLKAPSSLPSDYSKKRRRKDTQIHHDVLLSWLRRQVALYNDIHIEDINKSFKDGLALCAIIHRYRPDLIDFYSLDSSDISGNNQLAFDILEKEYGVLPVMTGVEMEKCEVPDNLTMLSYLTQVYDIFRGEIPYTHQKKIVTDDEEALPYEHATDFDQGMAFKTSFSKLTPSQKLSILNRISNSIPRKRYRESRSPTVSSRGVEVQATRKPKKRKSGSSGLIDERKGFLERVRKKSLEKKDGSNYVEQQRLMAARIMKSVRMLQENSKQENENIPFEDYSMFLYRQSAPDFKERVKDLERKLLYPDRDPKELHEFKKNPMEENFSGRVKDIETKLKEGTKTEKKPKDLLRAIGKIEKSDWNIKEIEKKIEENKHGRGVQSSMAKVPKWNRQQFDDKFSAVKKKLIDKNAPVDTKYAIVDNTLKRLEQKLRNGTALEQGRRGANKVSAMAAHLTTLNQQPEEKLTASKTGSPKVIICSQGGSEICHFCYKRVYLMERLSAEGRFFHRGCFRCEYCGISLRLGNYSFDREGKYGSRFYCTQHLGYPGLYRTKLKNRLNDFKTETNADDYKDLDDIPKTPTALNLKFSNDSTDTPERVEFENLDIDREDDGNISRNEMDEDEWTDHNFGTSANELASSDDVSDLSESEEEEEDNEDEFAQALDIPALNNNESIEFARFSSVAVPSPKLDDVHRKNSRSSILSKDKVNINNDGECDSSSSDESSHHISYHEFESDDESDTATGEKNYNSKNGRLEEVRLQVPNRINLSDSGSDTEVASDEYSVSSDNGDEYDEDGSDEEDDEDDDDNESDSATEISTDSEFERNNSTVIKSEIPDIIISESLPTRKGHLEEVKTIQIVNKNVEKNVPRLRDDGNIAKLPPSKDMTNEVHETKVNRFPFVNPHRGDYYLNRTQSTEGVASKISLELKKKYLLGEDSGANLVKKSESTSVLDTKFKSLVDQISEHQKLLNPAPEPSLTMQAFLDGTVKLRNSSVSPSSSVNLRKSKELTGIEDFPHICSLSNNFDSINATISSRKSESSSQAETTDTSHTISKTLVEERPPSPVFETSIVVPEFPKKDTNDRQLVEIASTTDDASSAEEDEDEFVKSYQRNAAAQISLPKVEIHNSQGELLPHDVDVVEEKGSINKLKGSEDNYKKKEMYETSPSKTPLKGVIQMSNVACGDSVEIKWTTEAKDGSPLKIMAVPGSDYHAKDRDSAQILRRVSTPSELFASSDLKRTESKSSFSDKSSPSTPTSLQGDDNTLAVFTETELSDWARDEDGAVSENFDDLILGTPNITYRRHQKPRKKTGRSAASFKNAKLADAKEDFVHVCGKTDKLKPPAFVLADIDNMDIEFMDNGDDACSETADAVNRLVIKNSGYIEYVTSEDEAKTPLAEAINVAYPTFSDFGGAATFAVSHPEDIYVKTNGTTAEVFASPKKLNRTPSGNESNQVQDNEKAAPTEEFDNFVHRFQDRITPFGNVKDSIDVRKSRKNPKSPIIHSASSDNIEVAEIAVENRIPAINGPSQKLEALSRERSKQKNLIHEMVMSKLLSEGKTLYDRRAKRSSRNSLSPFNSSTSQNSLHSQLSDDKKDVQRVDSVDGVENKENILCDGRQCDANEISASPVTPAVHLSLDMRNSIPLKDGWSPLPSSCDGKCAESFSLPDLQKALSDSGDKVLTPVLPIASGRLEMLQFTESIKQQARTRARLMSDSELGLSPEDKLKLLKQKIAARKAVQSAYVDYPRVGNYLDEKLSFSNRVLDELQNAISEANSKSSVDEMELSPQSKTVKDKDRRKSIIQAVSDFFLKKSPIKTPVSSRDVSSTNKSKFKIPLMGKDKSRSADDVFIFTGRYCDKSCDDVFQQNYASECDLKKKSIDSCAPPRPPSPTCYTPNLDESEENLSVATIESKEDSSLMSASKPLRSSNRKTKRENQKKLRMAQEIQRQLEEIEVKQKELEFKGVKVEKALRNKNQNSESEVELMQELLEMIRERNELRKCEQKLLLKAKEIETDDPY